MLTAIITLSWRGFGVDKGEEYKELRLGFISFAIVKGILWKRYEAVKFEAKVLGRENELLRSRFRFGEYNE